MRVSVPGNLLLLGEYAVLEEGGLGLALAVEKRLEVELQPAPTGRELSVEGRWPGGSLSWSSDHPDSSPLIAAVVKACGGGLASRFAAGLPGARITIDSSAFFTADGHKRGFGSSAAVAVGLTWALLEWGGLPPAELPGATLRTALRAHREAQGGSGSGYDVYVSCLGGVGLFTGGWQPSWKGVDLPWLGALYSFRGERSVATPGAVRRYREWKQRRPREAARFLRRSNRYVRRFVSARSWGQAAPWFRALADLGIEVGEAIEVPARIEPPAQLASGTYKALGAGSELGVCVMQQQSGVPPMGAEPVWIARRGGVSWG